MFKSQDRKDVEKLSNPCHVVIYLNVLPECSHMSTYVPGFYFIFNFFASFSFDQISHRKPSKGQPADGYFGQYKIRHKSPKMTENLERGYSSEGTTRRELSNEYQHDGILKIFASLCFEQK